MNRLEFEEYNLKDELLDIANKFEMLESELLEVQDGEVWNFITMKYNSNPLEAIREFIEDMENGMYDDEC